MDDNISVIENNESKTNMKNNLTNGYVVGASAMRRAGYNIASVPAKAEPITLACQINVGDYSAKPTNEINPTVDKIITFLFYTLPLFCFQAVARPLMFLAAIALIIWGFCHGPLWCLVAVFVHFPIAFMLLRGTFCSWKSKETATIPEISL